jgi:TolA-binding protein
MLLKAQALFAQDMDQAGYDLLAKLRSDFHGTSAAKYSFLVQANRQSLRGDLTAAQGVLQSFVDNPEYQKSEYAPLALYEVALILERQGLDRQLEEANKKLEQLVKSYPDDDLVFYARLKQGDLMRKLNEFARARVIYEDLVNNLADTFFAQGANSVSNYESAVTIYERLRDLPAAPVDLRAEAGFKWGYALAKRALTAAAATERDQQLAKAQGVYWSVVDSFLLHPAAAEKLGAKGRYWVARALLELGQINEDAGRLDEAQRAYQVIVDQKLSGGAQAQAKLARLRNTGSNKP